MKSLIIALLLLPGASYAQTVVGKLIARVDSFYVDGRILHSGDKIATGGKDSANIKHIEQRDLSGKTLTYATIKGGWRIPLDAAAKQHEASKNRNKTTISELDSLPNYNGRVAFIGVDTVVEVSKLDLYARAKKWVVDNYRSANNVIQLDDKEGGELTMKGNFDVVLGGGITGGVVSVHHTIRLAFKDGRYRYEISEFRPFGYSSYGSWEYSLDQWAKAQFKKTVKRFNGALMSEVDETITSLKAAMNQPTISKSEW